MCMQVRFLSSVQKVNSIINFLVNIFVSSKLMLYICQKNMKHNFSDKEVLEELVKSSVSKREILRKLNIVGAGGNYKTLDKYLKLYEIDTTHFTGSAWNQGDNFKPFGLKMELESILIENSTYSNSSTLKKRLYREGLKTPKCENCGIEKWLEKELSLELDHINGINTDNRINNLRILCPNCHSQTETFRRMKGSKPKKLKVVKEKIINNCMVCNNPTENKTFCSNKCVEIDRGKNIPSKEELLKRINTIGKNYTAIGKSFGVSDNSVRKWVKKYNIQVEKR